MLNKNNNYIFIITNSFSFIYFLWIIKKYELKNIVIIINNSYNFFMNSKYDNILDKLNIKYIIITWEDKIKSFPYSIIDIIKIKQEIKKKCILLKWYQIITWHDYITTDQLILKFLKKNNILLWIINNNIIKNKYNFDNIIYSLFYLIFFWINKFKNLSYIFNYKFKILYKDIDKNIIFDNILYLKTLFSNKLESLNNIKWNKNIIFLSQNIIDEYWINKDLFIKKLIKIQNIYKNKWFNFYIKPHPLENASYYEKNFNLIDKSIPSELLDIYFWDKETIYITYFSTVINNLQFWKKYLIWDIWFWENEKQIINMLNKDFNIQFLNYE